jgi:hypothetical protein
MRRRLVHGGCFALMLTVILASHVWRATAAPLATNPPYAVTDLGTLGGADSS